MHLYRVTHIIINHSFTCTDNTGVIPIDHNTKNSKCKQALGFKIIITGMYSYSYSHHINLNPFWNDDLCDYFAILSSIMKLKHIKFTK